MDEANGRSEWGNGKARKEAGVEKEENKKEREEKEEEGG